jgi:hypothetical protein
VVDRAGKTVDFRLSAKRDVAAAKAFFKKAIKGQGCAAPTVTLDGYAASHRAARETKLRTLKYVNNMIEQDHRNVKLRIAAMLGFEKRKIALKNGAIKPNLSRRCARHALRAGGMPFQATATPHHGTSRYRCSFGPRARALRRRQLIIFITGMLVRKTQPPSGKEARWRDLPDTMS